MDIKKIIRTARKAAGMNQAELADACGWEYQSRISGYETGEREASLEDLEIIAKATGYTRLEDFLVGGKTANDVESAIGGFDFLTKEEQEFYISQINGIKELKEKRQ